MASSFDVGVVMGMTKVAMGPAPMMALHEPTSSPSSSSPSIPEPLVPHSKIPWVPHGGYQVMKQEHEKRMLDWIRKRKTGQTKTSGLRRIQRMARAALKRGEKNLSPGFEAAGERAVEKFWRRGAKFPGGRGAYHQRLGLMGDDPGQWLAAGRRTKVAGVITVMEKMALSPKTIGTALGKRMAQYGGDFAKAPLYERALEHMTRGKKRGVYMAGFDETAKLIPDLVYANAPELAHRFTAEQKNLAHRKLMKRMVVGRGVDRV
jgi:hypothetical protein